MAWPELRKRIDAYGKSAELAANIIETKTEQRELFGRELLEHLEDVHKVSPDLISPTVTVMRESLRLPGRFHDHAEALKYVASLFKGQARLHHLLGALTAEFQQAFLNDRFKNPTEVASAAAHIKRFTTQDIAAQIIARQLFAIAAKEKSMTQAIRKHAHQLSPLERE